MDEFKRISSSAHGAVPAPARRERGQSVVAAFSLENGAAQLREHFGSVDTRVYADELRITDPDAIVAYFQSLNEIRKGEQVLEDGEAGAFHDFVTARMARDGELRATANSGMFVCR